MSGPSILLTGGTGKTGRRLATRLAAAGHRCRIASRSGASASSHQGVGFDWSDPSTYTPALVGIVAVYLVAPSNIAEPLPIMRPFLEEAMARGVRRFVLLSASSLEAGGPMMGAVHAYLEEHAPEWGCLRPSWFMQNFSEQHHLPTLGGEGRIYSATGGGRVPFVDADDVAACAVVALTHTTPFNRDILITGPEALSYGDVARIIGEVIGRPIAHVRLSEDDLVARFRMLGVEGTYARILAAMESAIAQGDEDRITEEVETVTGRRPRDLATFARDVRRVWNG